MDDTLDDSQQIPSIALPQRGTLASWWVRATLLLCSPAFIAVAGLILFRLMPREGAEGIAKVFLSIAYVSAFLVLPCWPIAFATALIGSFVRSVPGSGKAVMWVAVGLAAMCVLALA